jgi:hypothetical protein
MPPTFNSRRLRLQREMDARLAEDHRNLARWIAGLVFRAATQRGAEGESIVPNLRSARADLKNTVWEQALKPYYVGTQNDPLKGIVPQSPYARLLVDGIEGQIRIQAERQVAFLQKTVKDQRVLNWLTSPRSIRPATREFGAYDAFHQWIDPNGFQLSDRIWRASIDVRSRINRFLDYHIAAGTSAVRMAALLEKFLTPGGAESKTRTPYGTEGSFAARRLARTEIAAAAGRATVNASIVNPFVEGVQWTLSASHGKPDICDDNASGGPNGDGVYAPDQVPPYPAHPHDLCNLQPVAVGNVSDLVAQLRSDIQARNTQAFDLQGAFNLEFMVGALLSGFFIQSTMPEAA